MYKPFADFLSNRLKREIVHSWIIILSKWDRFITFVSGFWFAGKPVCRQSLYYICVRRVFITRVFHREIFRSNILIHSAVLQFWIFGFLFFLELKCFSIITRCYKFLFTYYILKLTNNNYYFVGYWSSFSFESESRWICGNRGFNRQFFVLCPSL